MISYLLWLCHRGKGSISKYGIRSQLKSCKMNTSGHDEESIKNVFFCVELCLLFSAGQLINNMRMRCQTVLQALRSSTRYWALIMSLKSMNIDEIKDPCDNKHENPCKSSPITVKKMGNFMLGIYLLGNIRSKFEQNYGISRTQRGSPVVGKIVGQFDTCF